MQVYEYLNQAKRLGSEIECKKEIERELWAIATSTTQANDGMPHAPGVSDKVGNNAAKIAIVKNEINALTDKYNDARQDIIKHIKMLPQKQYDVLFWLYIKERENRQPGQRLYYTWSEVAEKLRCSEQNIANTRKRAIKNLKKILESEGKIQKMG